MKVLSNVDLDRIEEVFGEDYIKTINENINLIDENVKLLEKLKFDDIEEIFERCPDIFIYNANEFETKINKLIKKLGEKYVEKIEEDISIIKNL